MRKINLIDIIDTVQTAYVQQYIIIFLWLNPVLLFIPL